MRQQRWLEFLASYDLDIQYTPGKGNRVADALSRKHSAVVSMMIAEWDILETLSLCDIRDRAPSSDSPVLLFSLEARPILLDRIAHAQRQDPDLLHLIHLLESGSSDETLLDYSLDFRRCLRRKNRIVVPSDLSLRRDILDECHRSKYTIHPGSSKMYADMCRLYYWEGLKRDVTSYVSFA